MIAGGIRLPNSYARILEILSRCGNTNGVSQRQLRDETGLSERAVKYALKELVGKKLAGFNILLNDTRRKLYYAEVEK